MPNGKSNEEHSNEKGRLFNSAYLFEYWVVLILVFAVGVICVVALVRLFFGVYDAIIVSWNPKDYHIIQLLFGMVMTVLIALELGNSILRHIREHSVIVQAREVILIGIMAVVRKIMIIDMTEATPVLLASLGFVGISLAGAFWFVKEK